MSVLVHALLTGLKMTNCSDKGKCRLGIWQSLAHTHIHTHTQTLNPSGLILLPLTVLAEMSDSFTADVKARFYEGPLPAAFFTLPNWNVLMKMHPFIGMVSLRPLHTNSDHPLFKTAGTQIVY